MADGHLPHNPVNILVTTLGQSWPIIPELLGFTNPACVDLYRDHPQREDIEKCRRDYAIRPVDEMWAVTTSGEATEKSIAMVIRWMEKLADCPTIRIWRAADVDELGDAKECRHMGDLILRVVLHARERTGEGQLLLSLAGGRKTMSADMQYAASVFGCNAMLHVVDSYGNRPEDARTPEVDRFLKPFEKSWRSYITPLVVGSHCANPVFALPHNSGAPLRSETFPLKIPDEKAGCVSVRPATDLYDDVRSCLDRAGDLMVNYSMKLTGNESATNFLCLYHLPPATIETLKQYRLGTDPRQAEAELSWLKKLPKAELHCHLGGVADAAGIIEIAAANAELVRKARSENPTFQEWVEGWSAVVETQDADAILGELHRRYGKTRPFRALRTAIDDVPEPLCVSAFVLLFKHNAERLDCVIFGQYRNDNRFLAIDIEEYESLGDLQGSALLQTEPAIQIACRLLMKQAVEHNVRYLELRCSPINYTRGGLMPVEVVDCIRAELATFREHIRSSLIFIASRHGRFSDMYRHVELFEDLDKKRGPATEPYPPIVGFDLAGNESACSPEQVRTAFLSLMKKCVHLTVHAGETDDVDKMWQAVYHLNAERIGHGLKLGENPELSRHFLDRRVGIEMCPSSNAQIVGYKDACIEASQHYPVYPLKAYLEQGLRATVNTDNPGISRTNLTREYHRATRLSPHGLSKWQILQLIRNGYKSAFLPRSQRQALIKDAESEISKIVSQSD